MKTTRTKAIPRGIRNCNPLNIRIGNVWLGERDSPDDPAFEQFVSIEYGLRAGFVLLRRYIKHYKRKTIEDIISAWAPASENNTQAYIDKVSQIANIEIGSCIDYADKDIMCRLVDAMCLVECGQHVDISKIRKAYDIA